MPHDMALTKQPRSVIEAREIASTTRRIAPANIAAITAAGVERRRPLLPLLLGAALVAGLPAAVFPLTPAFSTGDSVAAVLAAAITAGVAIGAAALVYMLGSRGSPLLGDGRLLYGTSLCSAAAGAIHLAVAKMHFEEYALFGVFFVGAGLAQILWAMWVVVRRHPALFVLGAAGNAAIIALWGVDRIWGLPLGAEPWKPDPLGFGDVVTAALELLVVIGCVGLLGNVYRLRTLRPLTAVALTLVVFAVTTLSLLSVLGVASSILTPTG
jgi:hypothetical protein